MRAGWILLKIRHKQYGVNVDEVGADIIRPQIPQSAALTAPFTREPKKMREGDRRRRWRDYTVKALCIFTSGAIPQSAALTAPNRCPSPLSLRDISPHCGESPFAREPKYRTGDCPLF